MADSGSSHIKRNAPPRVQIQYEDPYDSERMVELPFVMGILSDLSGNNPGVEPPHTEDRVFADVTEDSLDDYMESVNPGVAFTVENRLTPGSGTKLGVELNFKKMADMEPAAIARQVPALRQLLEAREQLANLKRYISAKPKAQDDIRKLLDDPDLLAVLASRLDERGEKDDGDTNE